MNYIFLLLTLIAEIVGTIGGFGSSVFFVPIGNFFFDFHSVLGLTALFHLSSNLSKIMLFKKGLDKNLLINIGLPSVVFVVLGGFLTKTLNSTVLEILLALFLVGLSLLFLIKSDLIILPNKKNALVGGALSGFSAGLLGTGGAIRGLTMAAFNLEKNVFIATSAFIDFFIDFTRTFVYFGNGYIRKEHLIYLPFLLVIGFLGTYIGKRILNRIPQNKFKTISLLLILLIGIVSLAKVFIQA
ncbi:sulfite exporter TauE/SafE family protein [Marinilongibacter aquaticus]|uniref:sulfite exporter TauE/SafE family protein n=1 Tax=Marinilongibacter aquaticus TaxID=2975157 RepID=UPI0021BD5235|nr:sulfite exporter TauE/SafE family protein [Marinilongibacter aquaticus]UBM61022.1 sulfite exporter TauE/SafE family protein [Marinilongibacter aquaticus]